MVDFIFLSSKINQQTCVCLLQVNFIFHKGCLLNCCDIYAWQWPAEEHICFVVFLDLFLLYKTHSNVFIDGKTITGSNFVRSWTFPVKCWPSSTNSWRARGLSFQSWYKEKYLTTIFHSISSDLCWELHSVLLEPSAAPVQEQIPKAAARSDPGLGMTVQLTFRQPDINSQIRNRSVPNQHALTATLSTCFPLI